MIRNVFVITCSVPEEQCGAGACRWDPSKLSGMVYVEADCISLFVRFAGLLLRMSSRGAVVFGVDMFVCFRCFQLLDSVVFIFCVWFRYYWLCCELCDISFFTVALPHHRVPN